MSVQQSLHTLALQGWRIDGESELLKQIAEIAALRKSQYESRNTFLYYVTPQKRELIIHLSHRRPLSSMTLDLLDHFFTRIGGAFDNISMQNWLNETNSWLEQQVKARTEELSEKTMRLEVAQRQMAEELKLAHVLQQAILPTELPCQGAVEAAATMIPANHIGGDFYHLTKLDDSRVALIIADVSGKGVAAAFFMLRVHHLMQEIIKQNHSPSECLALANKRLSDRY